MPKNKEHKLKLILKTALKLFARYGYKKTTLEDVARDLGMTKSSLYFYVTNKRELYEMAVKHAFKEWQIVVVKAMSHEDDVVEKFKVMCTHSLAYLQDQDDFRSILMKDHAIFTLYPAEDRFYEINKGTIKLISDVLLEGIKQNRFYKMDVQLTAELLFSIYIIFLIKTYVKSEGVSVVRMYEQGIKILLGGICRPQPENQSTK